MNENKKTEHINLWENPEVVGEWRKFCNKTGHSLSSLIRTSVWDYINRGRPREEKSNLSSVERKIDELQTTILKLQRELDIKIKEYETVGEKFPDDLNEKTYEQLKDEIISCFKIWDESKIGMSIVSISHRTNIELQDVFMVLKRLEKEGTIRLNKRNMDWVLEK